MKNLGDQDRRFAPCLSPLEYGGNTLPWIHLSRSLTLLVEMALLTFSHAVVGLLSARLLCLLSKRKLAQSNGSLSPCTYTRCGRIWSAGGTCHGHSGCEWGVFQPRHRRSIVNAYFSQAG